MQITTYLSSLTGRSVPDLMQLVTVAEVPQGGSFTITRWDIANVPKPSDADLAAAMAEPEPSTSVANLAAQLVSAASNAAGLIAAQIVPDRTHELAYLNAAALVGPSATVPTVDPGKTAFTDLATANGYGDKLQAFATLVMEISAASMLLSALLASVSAASAQAKTATDLITALTAFEAGLASLLSTINGAGLTVTVTAPAPITVVGINA